MFGTIPGAPLRSSPTRTSMPSISFSENLVTVTSAQERQVVNELQSILDKQNQQRAEQSVPAMGSMAIKNEPQQNFIPMSCSAVPLDLQFPSAVVPVSSTVETSTGIMAPQVGFNEQAVTSSQFGPVTQLQSVSSTVQLLQRQGSMEMPNMEQTMITELMPTTRGTVASSGTLVSVASGPTANSVAGNCQHMTNSITAVSSAICQVGDIIKMEGQQTAPMGNHMNINIAIPRAVVTTAQSATPTSFMSGDLQPHQGTITNALTQMSDNELINFINPSCFEQNVPLV